VPDNLHLTVTSEMGGRGQGTPLNRCHIYLESEKVLTPRAEETLGYSNFFVFVFLLLLLLLDFRYLFVHSSSQGPQLSCIC
jgi:hypothetical protein